MNEGDAEFTDSLYDDGVDGLLLQFDNALRLGRSVSWDWYLSQCGDEQATVSLLFEMIRMELEHNGWDETRIKRRFDNFPMSEARDELILALVRQLYVDRIELGERPSLKEFEPFGLAFDQLELRTKNEPFFLGYSVGHRYRIEQRIGEGSFGIVYRGTDILQQTSVALKVSHGDDESSQLQARELLEQEANALRNLSHLNIPQFIDLVSEVDSKLCMVYELISGQSLHQLILLGPVPPQKVASISAAIADALDFAHRRGYVHRDLSTTNVLIDDSDRPYLLDFGLALSEATRFDTKQVVGGTRPFMSVESLSGNLDAIDGRADVWALGAIMHAMLSGRTNSLSSQPETAVFGAILKGSGNLNFPQDVPAMLVGICRKCLSGNRDDRFDTAGQVATSLHEFLDSAAHGSRISGTSEVVGPNLRLVAWRTGIQLGAASKDQATARFWLHQAIRWI